MAQESSGRVLSRVMAAGWPVVALLSTFVVGAPVFADDDPPLSDVSPPTVLITSPSEASTVSGGISVSAEAADDVGVAGVQFLLDGSPLGAEDTVVPYTIAWNTATTANGSHTLSARARDAAGNQTTSSPVLVTVSNTDAPSEIGAWDPLMTWPWVAVHMTLLPTGEVMSWDSFEGDAVTWLWHPTTQQSTWVTYDGGLFCNGHTLLADGRVLAAGGHPHGENHQEDPGEILGIGINEAHIFDPVARRWSRVADMRFPRWYATLDRLSDGSVLAIRGTIANGKGANTPEIYNPLTDTWRLLRAVNTASAKAGEYLRVHSLPDGRILAINAADRSVNLLNPETQSWVSAGSGPMARSSTVMYRPGKILLTGGGDSVGSGTPAQTIGSVIDMNQPAPAWRRTASMRYGRFNHNLLMLPDGRVLVVGGSSDVYAKSRTGQLAAELWDPATEAWTTLASMTDPRMYHSSAILLPDGRVLVGGGGRSDPAEDYFSAQIYSPPYLFKGPRPTILSAPPPADYGQTFLVQTPDALNVASVALISLGSNTHAITMNQAYVELSFTAIPGALVVESPSDERIAPPGPYLLFIVDGNGVPSTASLMVFPAAPPAAEETEFYVASASQVVMEAEHYDEQIPRDGHDWRIEVFRSGFSRSAYLTALPNTGTFYSTGYVTNSPELIYRVKFATPGTYYVWVRGLASSGNDDSLHAGLDGAGPASADRLTGFSSTSWVWKRGTMDGAPATLVIPTAGVHTVHLWMREDGLRVDKLLLRTSSSSTAPSGTGPSESPRGH